MAQVTQSQAKKRRNIGLLEEEAPEPDNSEGNRIIKELVLKQTNKTTSLEQQLALHQNFTSSSQKLTSEKFRPGQSSLSSFSAQTQYINFKEELRIHGLNDLDIEMAMDLQRGEDFFRQKHKILDAGVLNLKLIEIKKKLKSIETKNVLPDEAHLQFGRHERELLQSVYAQSDNSKIVKFTHQPSWKPVSYPDDHPMNHLSELEEKLFGHLKPSSNIEKRKRKRRDRNPEESLCEATLQSSDIAVTTSVAGGSQWDKKEVPVCLPVAAHTKPSAVQRTFTCSPQTWYTIKDNKPHFLGCKIPHKRHSRKEKTSLGVAFVNPVPAKQVPIEEILSDRLSLLEIIQMPRFINYVPGAPSSTLFIKNLSSCVQEDDLAEIFSHFEDPDSSSTRLVYRLMGGKMKGQAFIKFPSILLAEKALHSINGYKLKGKPIIIQFGRK